MFNDLKSIKKVKTLFEAVEARENISLSNVKSGLKGFLAALTGEAFKRNVIYITHSDREAGKKAEILSRISPLSVGYFPLEPVHDYFSDAHSPDIVWERMTVIEKLFSDEPQLVVVSIDALLKKLMPASLVRDKFLTITCGDVIDLSDLAERLSEMGYERVYQVEAKGQFAIRGGIVDIFGVTAESGCRIEFFDDEVDSLRRFDVDSQLSYEPLARFKIAPAREILLSEAKRKEALKAIRKSYGDSEKTAELLERLETGAGSGDETFFAFLKMEESLIDYAGDAIIIWDEYTRSKETYEVFIKKTWEDYELLIEQGTAVSQEKNKFYSFYAIEKMLEGKAVIKENLFSSRSKKGQMLDMNAKDLESFAGQLPLFVSFINKRLAADYRIHICCKNEKTKANVVRFLEDQGIFQYAEGTGPGIILSQGEISEGFELEEEKIVYINESEFFREKRRTRRQKHKGKKIDSFAELRIGEYVVHDTHGIGIYKGIEQMTIDGITKDLMVIEYAGDARFYIPVEQMDTVQVYIGNGDKKPKLNTMGNPDWSRTKAKAKKSIEVMAEDLIKLYAKRRALRGYAFAPDSSWQQEFEDAFPHVETEDQLRCVEEIKMDMESPIPMDRLLCGDVGYGKTEVALRAAFKAVMEGKQVVMLVPTTVLAQQHYQTVKERFKKYPITVDVLSRFRTRGEQNRVVAELALGKVDFVVGTHRLLSKDIHFKDLGLLIIDEEQRFGVRSKEKIKQLRENVDVLTLSATPIPRTLHMSMTGVRDMSVIEEPPAGRRPVQTYVMVYNPLIITDAINRELGRGGQVYYIHNRIQDIDEVAARVAQMVPDARIGVAHGSMTGAQLEDIMADFLEKEFDILVTTTIVESGLDVKNANTMIVDEGDHFGLSQLYQLRGRVGRSDVQAYAYVTHKKEILTDVAQKRLKAIKDFTAFGSGFKVAMRDLEIRGAGNILGSAQSGHMYNVGYEMYCRILEETMTEKMQGSEVQKREPVRIQLNVNGYIPENYIEDEALKYDIYKKLTFLRSLEDYDNLESELLDRFGDVPHGVYNLMAIAMIKNRVMPMGITEIRQMGKKVRFLFDKNAEIPAPPVDKLPTLFDKHHVKFMGDKEDAASWSISLNSLRERDVLDQIRTFLEEVQAV